MHRVGGPVGCPAAKIRSRTLLGLQEVAPRGLLAWTDVCDCSRHPKGVGLVQAAFIRQERNVSSLTQVSMLQTESVVGGSHEPACYTTPPKTLKSGPNRGYGIRARVRRLVSMDATIFFSTTNDCYFYLSLPINLRDGHWFDQVPHQGDRTRGTCR